MRRSISESVLLVAAALAAGCDTDAIAPPAPGRARGSSSSSSSSGAMPARAKELALVLPAGENYDLALYDLIARNEAGIDKVFYRSFKPAAGPSAQARLIGQAAGEGASALVVVPDDSKETADALAALDPKKTPVVLLGRSPTGEPRPSGTAVAFEPFAVSAKALAGWLVEDLKRSGAPDGSSAILMTRIPADETSAERDAALAAALKDAGIPVVATVKFGIDPGEADKALEPALREHPEAWAVVADDDAGIQAGNAARRAVGGRRYVVSGYFAMRNNLTALTNGQVSGLADRDVEGLVRRAVKLAIDRSNGGPAPPKVVVPIVARRGKLIETPPPQAGPLASPIPIDASKLLAPPKPVAAEKKDEAGKKSEAGKEGEAEKKP